jgi:hypothetical protein
MKTTSTKDGLWGMWRDLTEEPAWKYEELPPLLLTEVTKLDLFEAGDMELVRAHWFWSRRPKLSSFESAGLVVLELCALASLALVVVAWSGTSMPDRFAEIGILLLELPVEIYLILRRLSFFRWRREYELSIDRLIRTIHPGYEGGSTIGW